MPVKRAKDITPQKRSLPVKGKVSATLFLQCMRPFLMLWTALHGHESAKDLGVWRELIEINPKYSFREHFSRQGDIERDAEGLAKAGLLN